MKHVKYFSKRPADDSVKQFSSKSGYVRRFSAKAKGEISLSGMDPDKYYLYKDSNVTIPGFAIDKGGYITSGSRFSRGYQLTKAYGPFDTASEAEAYANESGISLIDTTAVEETQPEVTEMSGDNGKLNELEAKVDTLTNLVTELTNKLGDLTKKDEVAEPETENSEEEPVAEETPEVETTEEVTEVEEPASEETVVEESGEDVCPNCGNNPCTCEVEEESADNGVTDDDVGLGEKVPANTGDVETVYTQVPEKDILAQFSNSFKPEPEETVSMSNLESNENSMLNVLFR